ncbi:MAG: DUF503 domain-containing protein [Anaerolineales bacterium]|nr:DUF503 domain-containing protein [Anaerolineales bacterium]
MIGQLTLHLRLPCCASLKEKRSRLKPLLHRLGRQFNVSVAEVDRNDCWQEAVVACAMVANNGAHLQSALETVCRWVESNWPDGDVLDTKVEII